jgi:O-antigen/teichoic acid export membrane protein
VVAAARASESTRVVRPLTDGAVRSGVSQFINVVGGALTTLVLATILGPAGAGRYAVALSLVLGLFTFATLSLQLGVGYFVGSGTWAPRRALIDTHFAAVVLGAASIGAAVGIRAAFPSAFHGLNLGLVVLAAASVPFALSWMFASSVALAIDQYELYAMPFALQASIGFVAIVSFGAAYGVAGAVLGLTLSHAATAAVTLWRTARSAPAGADRDVGRDRLRQAVVFGLKGHAANVLAFITYRLDIFILNGTAAASAVGQYSIAVSVTQAIWLLPRALGSVVVPRIAQVSAGRATVGSDYQELVERKSVRHATILAVLSALALVGVLLLLVQIVLGPRFHQSIELGLILVPGSVLLGIGGTINSVMVGRGAPEYSLIMTCLTAPVAVVLYAVLIPAMGATGAALGSSVAYGFGFLVSVVLARRMMRRAMLPMFLPARSEFDDYRRIATTVLRRVSTAPDC